jgi:glycosyltransferase involved in cell wall biosynthesis
MDILFLSQWVATSDNPGFSRIIEISRVFESQGANIKIITSDSSHFGERQKQSFRRSIFKIEKYNKIEIIKINPFFLKNRGKLQRILLFLEYFLFAFIYSMKISKPDIVYCSSPPSFVGLLGRLVSFTKGTRLIYEARELWPERIVAAGELNNKLIQHLLYRIENSCIKTADLIIGVSKGDVRDMKMRSIRSNNRFIYIPHGYDSWMINSNRKQTKESHANFTCLFAGQLNKFQCVHQIIEVAEILKNEKVCFEIYGEGERLRYLKNKVKEKGLMNISFFGVVSKSIVFDKMQEADVCLLFSGKHKQYSQWLPNKIFDYFASGTPVVAMGQGELAALVEKAGGVLVSPDNTEVMAEKILQLSKNSRSERYKSGMQARNYILSHYSRNYQWYELYKKIKKDLVC